MCYDYVIVFCSFYSSPRLAHTLNGGCPFCTSLSQHRTRMLDRDARADHNPLRPYVTINGVISVFAFVYYMCAYTCVCGILAEVIYLNLFEAEFGQYIIIWEIIYLMTKVHD